MTERTLQEERVVEQMLKIQRNAMLRRLRETIPEQIAKELVSVQPINITKEQWDALPAALAAVMGTHKRPCCMGIPTPPEDTNG